MWTITGSTRGHLIGPGRRNVLTMHARMNAQAVREIERAAQGRYVWHPLVRQAIAGKALSQVFA